MKNAFLFTLLVATLGSCQKEDLVAAAPTTAYPQTWQLVKRTSSWTQTVQTGRTLPWQETYVFQADSTFTKTHQQQGEIVDAHGTFSVRTSASGPYALLTYNAPNNLMGSCTPDLLQEHLIFQPNDTLVNTWQACDGPRLEYKKVVQ